MWPRAWVTYSTSSPVRLGQFQLKLAQNNLKQRFDIYLYRIDMYLYTTLSSYFVLYLHNADFIMPIFAQVSDVVHGASCQKTYGWWLYCHYLFLILISFLCVFFRCFYCFSLFLYPPSRKQSLLWYMGLTLSVCRSASCRLSMQSCPVIIFLMGKHLMFFIHTKIFYQLVMISIKDHLGKLKDTRKKSARFVLS